VGAREWGERLSRRARRGARRGGGGERVPTDGPSVPVGRAHTLSRRARVGNQWARVRARESSHLPSSHAARSRIRARRFTCILYRLSPVL